MEEFLYSAMEDYKIDLIIDKGPSARSVQIQLKSFHLDRCYNKVGFINKSVTCAFWN